MYGVNRATQLVRELRYFMKGLFELYKMTSEASCSTIFLDSSDKEGDDIDTL